MMFTTVVAGLLFATSSLIILVVIIDLLFRITTHAKMFGVTAYLTKQMLVVLSGWFVSGWYLFG